MRTIRRIRCDRPHARRAGMRALTVVLVLLAVSPWSVPPGSHGATRGPLTAASGPLFDCDVQYAVGDGPYDVAVGDLNGDGAPDLAVANTQNFTGTGSV